MKKVYYFSDGAASQYKNKKNFVNLAFHNRDFKNIEAEWHFFATAHGKGPCDGLGGTVKRKALRASLKRPLEGQIQTPQELSEWAKDAIPSVTFEFVDKSEVEAEERALQERLDAAVTIEGTQSYHAYYQLKDCTNKLMVKTYSRSLSSEIVQISNHREPILSYFSESRLINGKIHTNIRIVTLEKSLRWEKNKNEHVGKTWGWNVRITINAITMTPPNQP